MISSLVMISSRGDYTTDILRITGLDQQFKLCPTAARSSLPGTRSPSFHY